MFSRLDIRRFRGIQELRVDNLSNVNIFLGRNNSGKTTILEAVFLGCSRGGNAPLALNVARGSEKEQIVRDNAFLFHCRDYSKSIYIGMSGGSKLLDRHAIISPVFSEEDKVQESIATEGLKSTLGTQYPTGLRFRMRVNEEQQQLSADYLPSQRIDANTLVNYRRLVELNQKGDIVELLRKFDPNVIDLEIIGDEVFIRVKGMEAQLLPLSFAGDGLRRFLAIWVAVSNPDNRLILIDEIDNGIHHSSYGLLWETLFVAAKKNGVQVFITTHSDESLDALKSVAQEHREAMSIYSLARTKRRGLQAYHYDYDKLLLAKESLMELRD